MQTLIHAARERRSPVARDSLFACPVVVAFVRDHPSALARHPIHLAEGASLNEHTQHTPDDPDLELTMSAREPEAEGTTLLETLGLVRRAQADDRAALDQLFARYDDVVRHIVVTQLGPALEAREGVDDLVQDALFSVFKALDRFEYRSHGEFIAFLAKVTANAVRNRGKYHQARKRRDDGLHSNPKDVPAEQTGPGTLAARKDEFSHVMDHALQLPQKDRALLALYLMYGEDWVRIGAELRIDNDAARMRWNRIRQRVAETLGRREQD